MKTASPRKSAFALAALSIGVYFLWLSGGGIHTGFSHDDLMNVWRAWQESLPHLLKANLLFFLYPLSYRPLGGLFYHIFFAAFGFDALPYRLFLLVFLLANIYLVYAVARRLSGSLEIGAVTALLHGYHLGFVPLYRNTGTCYDILCFFFYFSAFLYYLRIRQQDRLPRPWEQVKLLALLICALDSKEIAVTLPLMMGVYELIYHPPRRLFSWLTRECRVVCWGAVCDAAFIAGKLYSHDGVGRATSQYAVAISLKTFIRTLDHDLDEVFLTWGSNVFRSRNVIILLAVLILIAWLSRWKHFRFELVFWLAGVLPVAFIPPRSIYAVYIPLAGFDLCVAALLIAASRWLWRGSRRWLQWKVAAIDIQMVSRQDGGQRLLQWKPRAVSPGTPDLRQIVTFAVILCGLAELYYVKGARAPTWHDDQSGRITAIVNQLASELPKPKPNVHLLFLKDPFAQDLNSEWALVFITQLLYRDAGAEADRLWKLPEMPDAERMKHYDYVFTLENGRLVMVFPNPPPPQAPIKARWTPLPVLIILLGAGLTLGTALVLGLLVVNLLRVGFYPGERALLAFICGSAVLSNLVFLLAAAGEARKGAFLIVAALAIAALRWVRGSPAVKTPLAAPLPAYWIILAAAVGIGFSWYYLANAVAPEVSSDGIAYHLGLVYQYARAHTLPRITTNFYASLSQGLEMLFLFAFSIAKHSAAALVHLAYLFALPALVFCYAKRYAMPVAGVCAAILTFAAPVMGADGVVAYNDVAAACVVFAAFYLLQIWSDDRDRRILALAGLLAGFAYAVKYPMGLAVPYGVALISFRTGWKKKPEMVRSCAIFLGCAAICIAPWMLKNWLFVSNPLAPFGNRYFPNPYMTADFEETLRGVMAHANGLKLADIPWEFTVSGYRSTGQFGWVFLLAPLALLSLRKKEGRQLLLAAFVFALPVLTNLNSRFFIPAVPFLALAMGMVFAQAPRLAAVVVLAHAITSLPPVLRFYCHQWSWRLTDAPWAAALRLIPEDTFIASRVSEYPVAKMVEARVPLTARTFSFERIPASYCARDVMVYWWGAENLRLRDTMYGPMGVDTPNWRFTFSFPWRSLLGIRIVSDSAASEVWKISEVTLMHANASMPTAKDWQLTAKPFPWNMQLAIDGNPATCWRSDRALAPGMFYQIRFGGRHEDVDTVVLDSRWYESPIKLTLEGEVESGKWRAMATAIPAGSPLAGINMRREATAELRRSGIGYILIPPMDIIRKDVDKDPDAWGLVRVDDAAGWRLYRIP